MKTALIITSCVLMALCTGCGTAPDNAVTPTMALTNTPASTSTLEASPMLLRYLGHSSFYLLASDGSRIVTDPYGGYPPFLSFPKGIAADVITISHSHADHTAVGKVGGQPAVLLTATSTMVGKVKVTGYPALHGEYQGAMVPNTVFVFECDGMKIVHLGELGKIDSADTLNAIADADVMLVPIGVTGSMSYDQLQSLIEQTKARTVIPQHFSLSVEHRWYRLGTVDEFLAAMPGDWPVQHEDELRVTPGMPRQIVVMTNQGEPQ